MPKFQKKAVIIEAVQFDGTMDSATNITEWAKRPDGISAVCGRTRNGDVVSDIRIETLEGTMTARPGDWIIRGVAGEFYPCKPDIFQQTYEPAALTQQVAAKVSAEDLERIDCFCEERELLHESLGKMPSKLVAAIRRVVQALEGRHE